MYETIPYIEYSCFHIVERDGKWKLNIYGQKKTKFFLFFLLVFGFFTYCVLLFCFKVLLLHWILNNSWSDCPYIWHSKPDSARIICKTYIFIKSNLFSYKDWKQN